MSTIETPDQLIQTLDTSSKTSNTFKPKGLPFVVRVRGTFVANLRLQESRDVGVSWDDLFVFTAGDVIEIGARGDARYRLDMSGIGDFTSGSADVFLGTF